MAAAATDLSAVAQKNADRLERLEKTLGTVITKLEKTPAQGYNPRDVLGGPGVQGMSPWARNGEDPMSSRGFQFMKMLGVLTGAIKPQDAKVEMDIHNRLNQVYVKDMGNVGYVYGGGGYDGVHRFLAPLATSYMQEQIVPREFRQEMKALVYAGTDGCDPHEAQWIRRKALQSHGYGQKTLSWLNETLGGALVAPPEMGELIELLRNKEALVNAGARTVPLPPQGRLQFPRQTAPSTTYWVGENQTITASDIGTGLVTLQAKKLAVLIKTPNELIRFASPAAEALIRDDMTKSLALALDLAGLEGAGGDYRPRGILNMPFINRVNSSRQTADGDLIVPEDIYRMTAVIEESNAEMEGWIMRPKTWFKYLQLRADAVAQGDRQGMFMFNMIREPGENPKPMLSGYPVTKSTQVSQVRTKGNASNLTYILAGMWSDLLIGMFGAIEFAATTQGDTAFTADQSWVRGIISADIAARHEAAFALLDNLSTTLG